MACVSTADMVVVERMKSEVKLSTLLILKTHQNDPYNMTILELGKTLDPHANGT